MKLSEKDLATPTPVELWSKELKRARYRKMRELAHPHEPDARDKSRARRKEATQLVYYNYNYYRDESNWLRYYSYQHHCFLGKADYLALKWHQANKRKQLSQVIAERKRQDKAARKEKRDSASAHAPS